MEHKVNLEIQDIIFNRIKDIRKYQNASRAGRMFHLTNSVSFTNIYTHAYNTHTCDTENLFFINTHTLHIPNAM